MEKFKDKKLSRKELNVLGGNPITNISCLYIALRQSSNFPGSCSNREPETCTVIKSIAEASCRSCDNGEFIHAGRVRRSCCGGGYWDAYRCETDSRVYGAFYFR
ncbi:MAG: hypothetical protein ACPGJS_06195 [Flammeovirgaceae bacterium]